MAGGLMEAKDYQGPVGYVVQEHHTNICGLSKQEYIALELTKVWANVAFNSYFDEEEIVDRYVDMLNEVKARKL